MNSSKLTHSLWLISLCLSSILLPVFEALQWADDCLGRDYYTNLSTLSAKPSAQGACVCVCVFLGFIAFSLHKRKSLCACSSIRMQLCAYVCTCLQYLCVCSQYMHVCEFHDSNLLLPLQLLPSGCHFRWLPATIHH